MPLESEFKKKSAAPYNACFVEEEKNCHRMFQLYYHFPIVHKCNVRGTVHEKNENFTVDSAESGDT